MDEQKLSELFRDATRDAPPASFDVGEVRAASARATARRRSAVAVGSALAVVLVFGGVVVSANLFANTAGDTAAAVSAEGAPPPDVTRFGDAQAPALPEDAAPDRSGGMPPRSVPDDPSTQGDEPLGTADRPTVGRTPGGCVEVDRELAVALADELPVARGLQPAPAAANCPVGARGASYLVRDGGTTGTVSVVVAPAGTSDLAVDPSVRFQSSPTPGGEELYVLSEPAAGSSVAPFADELASLAQRLGDRF
ncbi:hypothetical protein [Saccharothrix longispora]|uniref:hypothetical protein n=1 Tax=Saccharothrix longispora TaxID=33920 RepID=UPI0028FD5591|nr:hypothetical protein [Saccharothrix longispora]MBY8848083.1 hypothetical protein [Saccharothrix sp. MB29]MDU0291844.1 hypothetical protein [Saccharothrix longispora]